jgi:hypothetical protein
MPCKPDEGVCHFPVPMLYLDKCWMLLSQIKTRKSYVHDAQQLVLDWEMMFSDFID